MSFRKEPKIAKLPSEAEPLKNTPRVLKLKEGVLYLDGKYVGEAANLSDGVRAGVFEFEPNSGTLLNTRLVTGKEDAELLDNGDLVSIPDFFGHITIASLFDNKPGKYSDFDFMNRLYSFHSIVRNRISKIEILIQALEVKWDRGDLNDSIQQAARDNKHYDPQELFKAIISVATQKVYWGSHDNEDVERKTKLNDAMAWLRNCGILDLDEEKSKEGMVSFFYLYCWVKGVDITNVQSIRENAFDNYLLTNEILEEYDSRADSRFGDALLVACSLEKMEMQRLKEEEEAKQENQ